MKSKKMLVGLLLFALAILQFGCSKEEPVAPTNSPVKFFTDMVLVQGGTFQMGNDYGAEDEKPVHDVVLRDYYIGRYEITQREWVEVMGNNPSYFKGDALPVEQVSWNDIQLFIQKLNQKTGMKYRLPTEAEWEFAARGGNNRRGYSYSGSPNSEDVSWQSINSGGRTNPIGTKQPNELGLYDLSGNVWEWCQDWYDSYPATTQNNPTGPVDGSSRILRGGCWLLSSNYCRVSNRMGNMPDKLNKYTGFRLAMDK